MWDKPVLNTLEGSDVTNYFRTRQSVTHEKVRHSTYLVQGCGGVEVWGVGGVGGMGGVGCGKRGVWVCGGVG